MMYYIPLIFILFVSAAPSLSSPYASFFKIMTWECLEAGELVQFLTCFHNSIYTAVANYDVFMSSGVSKSVSQ